MTRYGRVIGRHLPGQFMATRVRVVASEMSTPERVARGRDYAASGSVVHLAIDPGRATARVQGSRQQPYDVTLDVAPGDGPPSRSEMRASCSCPDEPEAPRLLCKHSVATMIAVASEIARDPETLARWRAATASTRAATTPAPAASAPFGDPGDPADPGDREPDQDAIAAALVVPPGAAMPEVPDLTASDGPRLDDELSALLSGALAILRGEGTAPGAEASKHPNTDPLVAD